MAFFALNFISSQELEIAQYGLYNIILAVIMFGMRFMEVGIGDYYVIEGEVRILNTIFKVNLIKGLIISIGLLLSSFFFDPFYGTSDLFGPIAISSIIFVLEPLKNPMVYELYKKRQMARIVLIEKGSYLLGLMAGIGLMIHFKSIWALVFAYILYFVIQTVVSYFFIPVHNLKGFDKKYAKNLIHFSKQILGFILLTYFIRQGLDLVVPKLIGIESFAVYAFTFLIGISPTNFLIYPLNKLIYPVYAAQKEMKESLSLVFNKIVQETGVLLTLFSLLIYFTAPVFLKKINHIELLEMELLQYILVYGVLRGVTANLGVIYRNLAEQKTYNRILILEAVVLFLLLPIIGHSPTGIIFALGIALLVHLTTGLIYLKQRVRIDYKGLGFSFLTCFLLLLIELALHNAIENAYVLILLNIVLLGWVLLRFMRSMKKYF